jgi:BCD family chlorophyll transporter-like MFS transporter
MIKELGTTATLFALFASLPYLFSPIQVAIGSFSDRHPLWGWRRTPYIALGLLLCVLGVSFAPVAAFAFTHQTLSGLLFCIVAFGAWGMGFNFATVSYFSLASELSGEKGRSRTIAVMFFLMILSIILTAIGLSRLLEDYSPETLIQAFRGVGLVALLLGGLGLAGLEPRRRTFTSTERRQAWGELLRPVVANRQARLFFIYLILMLAAILGQDNLLEPFAAQTFHLSVSATTRITSVWGTCTLLCLLVAGALEGRVPKRRLVQLGSWGAALAFGVIIASGVLVNRSLFYAGVVILGLATGLATVSNLSLMLDMTTTTGVGLFIGAWGMADALARLTGNLVGGILRDTVTHLTNNFVIGYLVVFGLEALMLILSLALLRAIDVSAFRAQTASPSVVERMAVTAET